MVVSSSPATGLVIAAYGRQFLVRDTSSGREAIALARGRDLDVAVGDRVVLQHDGRDPWIVESVARRRSVLRRSASHRSKVLAANIDQVAVIIAPEPHFSEDILLRVSIAAAAANIRLMVIANKADHPTIESIQERLGLYETLGVTTAMISARDDGGDARRKLTPHLAGKVTLLCGESGMGKSTLLNLLVPAAAQRTNEISTALNSGRHTTTSSRLFDIDPDLASDATLIDSPGFQQFGLAHLSGSEREHAMPDLAPYLGKCRFNNCRHDREPGCAVRAAVDAGDIDALRYRLFLALDD